MSTLTSTPGTGMSAVAAKLPPDGMNWPAIPDRIEDLGIPRSVVNDLVLRYLWLHGSASLESLNKILKLSFPVLEVVFHQFRQQHLLDVRGMIGDDYSFA